MRYELEYNSEIHFGEVEVIGYVEGTPVANKWQIKLDSLIIIISFNQMTDRIIIISKQDEKSKFLGGGYKSLAESVNALPKLLKQLENIAHL